MKLVAICALSACLFVLLASRSWSADGQDQEQEDSQRQGGFRLTVPTPTLGGTQFWTDELIFRGWRIQKNAFTGHYRLLDDENDRRAGKSYEECRGKLNELREGLALPPVEGEVVLVLHGLGRSRKSMAGMCEYLEHEGGYTLLNMSYATTRGTVDDHAAALGKVVNNLDSGVTGISFVAHSLGNIVIRRFLHDYYRRADSGSAGVRVKRIVMLGPPNNGSELASRLPSGAVVGTIMGGSFVDLSKGWQSLERRLATPRCQFGIIAGGRGDDDGRDALLQGDDDWIVSVRETKLPGARDFVVLPVYHGVMMNDTTVRRSTLRFLQHGYFRTESERQPIVGVQSGTSRGG